MSRYRRVMLSRGRPAPWLPDCGSGHGRSEGVRWLCLLIHEEGDQQTFESLIEAWEELLAIRRQGLRLGRFEQQSEQEQRKFLQGGVPDSFLDASNAT